MLVTPQIFFSIDMQTKEKTPFLRVERLCMAHTRILDGVMSFFFFDDTIKGIKGKQTKDHKSAGLYLYQHWFIGT